MKHRGSARYFIKRSNSLKTKEIILKMEELREISKNLSISKNSSNYKHDIRIRMHSREAEPKPSKMLQKSVGGCREMLWPAFQGSDFAIY